MLRFTCMTLHPSFKKILFFCLYFILLSIIYSWLNVDINFIKKQNAEFYNVIKEAQKKPKPKPNLHNLKVSLNHAPKSELIKLKTIGPKTADKIIAFRTQYSFKTIEDVMKVKGIGKKRFKKIKKHLTL